MKRTLLPAICLTLAFLPATPSFAKSKAKPRPIEHHDTLIASVSAESITIEENHVPKTFKISQFTEVTVRGQKAALADLKPGMAVSVTMGTDPSTASRIAAGDAPVHHDPPRSGHY